MGPPYGRCASQDSSAHIFTENSDIQYIPVMVGAKLDL